MSLSQRIIELRNKLGMSQNQLAKAMDVSRQAVSKWENGQSTPDAARMLRLAEILDTDLEYLTTGRVVVPSRPPVVLETTKTVEVEKVVEKCILVFPFCTNSYIIGAAGFPASKTQTETN